MYSINYIKWKVSGMHGFPFRNVSDKNVFMEVRDFDMHQKKKESVEIFLFWGLLLLYCRSIWNTWPQESKSNVFCWGGYPTLDQWLQRRQDISVLFDFKPTISLKKGRATVPAEKMNKGLFHSSTKGTDRFLLSRIFFFKKVICRLSSIK